MAAPGYGFQPGDQAWLQFKLGCPVEGPKPIDLHDATLDEFRAWLGEVRAEAQRWS